MKKLTSTFAAILFAAAAGSTAFAAEREQMPMQGMMGKGSGVAGKHEMIITA